LLHFLSQLIASSKDPLKLLLIMKSVLAFVDVDDISLIFLTSCLFATHYYIIAILLSKSAIVSLGFFSSRLLINLEIDKVFLLVGTIASLPDIGRWNTVI
jgi:hypothetical protein